MRSINESSVCSKRARDCISSKVRRKLASFSNFACSICGGIPIIFHHIEEWSKQKSNDEQHLIPICDKCHRSIHGEGGNLFTKEELYKFKNNPKKPLILYDKLPLDAKRNYSFFIGSNFVSDGEKSNLIAFQDGHHLINIDTSSGILKLSVLGGIRGGNAFFVMKDNELMIDTQDIWDMHYSRNSLKIWKTTDSRKEVFINLELHPEIIILCEMNTAFNGVPLKIYKIRSPQKRQLNKMIDIIKSCEELYEIEAQHIDNIPKIYGTQNDIDFNVTIKQIRKDLIKTRLRQYLMFDYCKQFRWEPVYYQMILGELLDKSKIFQTTHSYPEDLQAHFRCVQNEVIAIREKYKDDFKSLKNVVLEYGGLIFNGNITLSF